ncbi:uncharacterized protein LOC143693861 [Agelaius phoeniceus]|uniref:uncharacterized protein LOC143693861 n=1 Tax=Agelaius phoeniceus TaxID=39638 RepID=UPI004054B14D
MSQAKNAEISELKKSLISQPNLQSLKSSLSVTMSLLCDWRRFNCERSYWSDEESMDREQNQQHPNVSSAAGNSPDLLARNDEEEPRNVDGAQPAGPANPPASEDEDSEDWEPPQFFRRAENSAEQPARDTGEEPRDNQGRWPDSVYVARFWMHYYSEWWHLRQQPHFVRAEDNSAVLVMGNNEEEQRDNDDAQQAGPSRPPASEDEDSEQ